MAKKKKRIPAKPRAAPEKPIELTTRSLQVAPAAQPHADRREKAERQEIERALRERE